MRLPWQQPFNAAVGCAVLACMLVLLVAGGDDVVALTTGTAVESIRTILRVLFFVVPAVTGVVVYMICKVMERRAARHPLPDDDAPAEHE